MLEKTETGEPRKNTHSKEWLGQLLKGEPDAVAEFWDQYGFRLIGLADKQLNPKLQGRVDAEDVVQSACRTFFRRGQSQQFQLEESESLWRLLCAIVVNKARRKARFHTQKKRGVDAEKDPSDNDGGRPREMGASSLPTPEEIVEYNDQFEFLMSALDENEKQLVQCKLESQTNAEIAETLKCSERTVRRLFAGIRSRLIEQFEDADHEFFSR